MVWFTVAFLSLAALAIVVRRRDIAAFQALILGGSIRPGCAVAQGVVLLLIALVIAVMHFTGS